MRLTALKKILCLLVMMLCLYGKGAAQLCGSGTFTFKFYVLNNAATTTLHYEILSATPQTISEIIAGDTLDFYTTDKDKLLTEYSPELYNHTYFGEIINRQAVEKILNKTVAPPFDTSGFQRLHLKKIAINGTIKKGILQFPTAELFSRPYLLKVTDGKKHIYILANLFGGCNRTAQLIWDDAPRMIKERRWFLKD